MDPMQANKGQLPGMRMVHQHFDVPPAVDVSKEIDREWSRLKERVALPVGKRVAVGVGSRGISNLTAVVREVVAKLKAAGCEPFVIPAMGSHGGATAEGPDGGAAPSRHNGRDAWAPRSWPPWRWFPWARWTGYLFSSTGSPMRQRASSLSTESSPTPISSGQPKAA